MPRAVSNGLGRSHGVGHKRATRFMHGLLQVEVLHDRCQIVCQRLEVISASGNVRTAVATPIRRDATKALCGQRSDMTAPHIRVECPRGQKDNRPAGSPVLHEKIRAVFGSYERVAIADGSGLRRSGRATAERHGSDDLTAVHLLVS
jgi:hypothetical protein